MVSPKWHYPVPRDVVSRVEVRRAPRETNFDSDAPERWTDADTLAHRRRSANGGMSSPLIVALGFVATGLGIVAVKYGSRIFGDSDGGPLSARRKAVLGFIAEVVPSQYGDSKFKQIAPGYDPSDPTLPRNAAGDLTYTTCGELPCYVGRRLGVQGCITQGGLEQMRINGRKNGSWVDADGKARPRPGDLFYIDGRHVGVIVDASGPVWKTADAGQGSVGAGQRADYVQRPYDAATNTIGGPGATLVPGQGWTVRGTPRKLAGWIDIDKVRGATS